MHPHVTGELARLHQADLRDAVVAARGRPVPARAAPVAIRMRSVAPSDRPHVERAFERLSRATIVSRFLGLVKPTPRLFDWIDELDGHDRAAVAAIDADTGTPLGLARWARLADDPTSADVAITVVDRWQHRGVGTALAGELARRARLAGITTFRATALAENRVPRLLMARLGEPCFGATRGGVVSMEVPLGESRPASSSPAAACC